MIWLKANPWVALLYPAMVSMILVLLVAAAVILEGLSQLPDDGGGAIDDAGLGLVVLGAFLPHTFVAVICYLGAGRTRFRCDDQTVSAFRGRHMVWSAPVQQIENMTMAPSFTWGELMFAFLFPQLPSAIVSVRDPQGVSVTLESPSILVWGKRRLAAAEEQFAKVMFERPQHADGWWHG